MRDLYAEKGYEVVRGAGSKGADLIAGRDGETLAIEVKATKAGPFSGFGPADRAEMKAMCLRAGWKPVLVWWPANNPAPKMYPPSEWPS